MVNSTLCRIGKSEHHKAVVGNAHPCAGDSTRGLVPQRLYKFRFGVTKGEKCQSVLGWIRDIPSE